MCRFEIKGVSMGKNSYEIANNDLEMLATEVIQDREDLADLQNYNMNIAFVRSDERKKSNGKIVFADTRKVSGVYSAFIPYDFIITFYEPNVAMLDEEQVKILMWHELKHCGVDTSGLPYLVPHDIEDFKAIIENYGIEWAN